jgi:hypothetical protein
MLLWSLGAVAGLAVIAVGVWVYVVNNVEQPAYRTVRADGAIELRDYPALVVAEVTRRGDRWGAVNAGFRPLAAYIFARERSGPSVPMTAPVTQQRIAMTAPVTQSRTDAADPDTWVVRFIMPSGFSLDTLPQPAAASDVRLTAVPAQRRAAIRFSGRATDASIAAEEAKLMAWLAGQGLKAAGPPTYAYYNDPWTPGPLRRNEVMVDVAGN